MKKQTTQIIAVIAVILVFATVFGYINWGDIAGQIAPAPAPLPGEPDYIPPIVPEETIRTGTFQWTLKTVTTQTASASGDVAYVGVCVADQNGQFNPLVYSERSEMAASPETSDNFYSAGDELLLAVSSDDDASGCNETYSRWFYIEFLDHGADILALPLQNPISALTEYASGSNYVYTVDGSRCEVTGQKVYWYEGASPYWQFGAFKLYERLADENTIVQHVSAGVVGGTYNDGATFIDADSDITANYTFTGDSQDIFLQLIGETANGAWGIPTLAVTSVGQIKQYQGVIIFATDAIALTTQPVYDDGWHYMDVPGLTNDIAFYYVVNDIPSLGNTLDVSVPITIDDTGLSGEYEFEVWFLDWQCVNDVARGSTSASVPSGNGVVAEVGADAVSQPVALTVSSNAVATPQLMGHFTPN